MIIIYFSQFCVPLYEVTKVYQCVLPQRVGYCRPSELLNAVPEYNWAAQIHVWYLWWVSKTYRGALYWWMMMDGCAIPFSAVSAYHLLKSTTIKHPFVVIFTFGNLWYYCIPSVYFRYSWDILISSEWFITLDIWERKAAAGSVVLGLC